MPKVAERTFVDAAHLQQRRQLFDHPVKEIALHALVPVVSTLATAMDTARH
jgi:hypothetical protein